MSSLSNNHYILNVSCCQVKGPHICCELMLQMLGLFENRYSEIFKRAKKSYNKNETFLFNVHVLFL